MRLINFGLMFDMFEFTSIQTYIYKNRLKVWVGDILYDSDGPQSQCQIYLLFTGAHGLHRHG